MGYPITGEKFSLAVGVGFAVKIDLPMKTPAFRIPSLFLACTSLFAADQAPQSPTPTDPDTCYKEAKALAEQGKQEEAFQKYLWAYDHGVEVNPKFARTRDTRVLPLLAGLGKKYPPAKAALVERRDALLKEVKAAPDSADTARAQQLGYLDLNSGVDSLLILETMAKLMPGTAVYKAYVSVVQERLVETKNYREAASGENVNDVIAMFEKTVRNVEKMRRDGKLDDKGEEKLKNNAIKAVPGVEMYAGSGDLKHAKQIADLLLQLSDTPEVRKALVEHLRRAKAEDLAAKYEKKK